MLHTSEYATAFLHSDWLSFYGVVAMYTGVYNLHGTRPVGECFQRLVSNPVYPILFWSSLQSHFVATSSVVVEFHLASSVVVWLLVAEERWVNYYIALQIKFLVHFLLFSGKFSIKVHISLSSNVMPQNTARWQSRMSRLKSQTLGLKYNLF